MARSKKKDSTKKSQKRADRIILDTAPNPDPAAPSNKANLEQNEKIREAAAEQQPVDQSP